MWTCFEDQCFHQNPDIGHECVCPVRCTCRGLHSIRLPNSCGCMRAALKPTSWLVLPSATLPSLIARPRLAAVRQATELISELVLSVNAKLAFPFQLPDSDAIWSFVTPAPIRDKASSHLHRFGTRLHSDCFEQEIRHYNPQESLPVEINDSFHRLSTSIRSSY